MTRRQTSGASSQVVPLPPVMPALLTRMSILPAAAIVRAVAAATALSSVSSTLLGDDAAGVAQRAVRFGELGGVDVPQRDRRRPSASMRSAMA